MKSILVFRSAGLGDFIMTSPAFMELKKLYPQYNIVLVTTQSFDKSTKAMVSSYTGGSNQVPWVDLARPHLLHDVEVIDSLSTFADFWLLRKRLNKYDFHIGILMLDPCSPWLGRLKKLILFFLIMPRLRFYGWRGQGSLNQNRARLKSLNLLRHHVHGPLQFMSELLPPVKYSDTNLKFDLRPDHDACKWAKSWLIQRNLLGRRLIAISPGAIQPHKQWPLSSFKILIERVLEDYSDLIVIIFGTDNDRVLGDELRLLDPQRIFNLAGESSIAQSAALFSYVNIVVGNDGGALHLADAMGCKVVSIVPGIEYPDSIEPWHNKELAVRWPVHCAPCYSFSNCPEGHRKCMLELPVDLVWSKCVSVL